METPKTPKTTTPLADWLRLAQPEQRERMAILAGTTVGYLYSLAGCHRGVPRSDLAFAIEDATETLHEESFGVLPVISARDLSTMCAIAGLDAA